MRTKNTIELTKELERLKKKCCCAESGGDSCCYEEITVEDAQQLVADSLVVPNKLYKITGVHKSTNDVDDDFHMLYDDGNNLGTTIYLTGITSTKFSVNGYGEFYNPNYSIAQYGESTGTFGWTIINGGEAGYSTGDNITVTGGSGTGMLISIVVDGSGIVVSLTITDYGDNNYVAGDVITIDGGDGFAQFTLSAGRVLYKIYDGDNPDISKRPGYVLGDIVMWGGYAWENITGQMGYAVDILTLNSLDWEKIPYTDTDQYTKVIDEIEYDFANDWIQRRTSGTIDVFFPYTYWNSPENNWGVYSGMFSVTKHAISATQWGNPLYDNNGTVYGVGLITLNDAYFETINFKGQVMLGTTLNHYSLGYDLYFGYGVQVRDWLQDNRSGVVRTKFEELSTIEEYRLLNDSWIDSVRTTNTSLLNFYLSNSWIQAGEAQLNWTNSNVHGLSLTNSSYWTDFNLLNTSLGVVSFHNESYMTGSMEGVTMSHLDFRDICYVTASMTSGSKYRIQGSACEITWNDPGGISEQDSIYGAKDRVYYIPLTIPAVGIDTDLALPALMAPLGWYISDILVSSSSSIGITPPSPYLSLGIETDNITSGLDAVRGLISTITGTPAQRYISLPFTKATDNRYLVAKLNAAGGAISSQGNVIVKVCLTNGYGWPF